MRRITISVSEEFNKELDIFRNSLKVKPLKDSFLQLCLELGFETIKAMKEDNHGELIH